MFAQVGLGTTVRGAMPIPISISVVLMLAAVQFWPVTVAIILACTVLALMVRIIWVRVVCGVVAAVVLLNALGGAWMLAG